MNSFLLLAAIIFPVESIGVQPADYVYFMYPNGYVNSMTFQYYYLDNKLVDTKLILNFETGRTIRLHSVKPEDFSDVNLDKDDILTTDKLWNPCLKVNTRKFFRVEFGGIYIRKLPTYVKVDMPIYHQRLYNISQFDDNYTFNHRMKILMKELND